VIYTVLNKGNRFRPLMTLIWCDIGGGKAEEALPLAAAIECIHTMSLIQDDLPCMDNATTRRN
jgi:geranylgeranyl diphosphate synthase type II